MADACVHTVALNLGLQSQVALPHTGLLYAYRLLYNFCATSVPLAVVEAGLILARSLDGNTTRVGSPCLVAAQSRARACGFSSYQMNVESQVMHPTRYCPDWLVRMHSTVCFGSFGAGKTPQCVYGCNETLKHG